MDLNYESGAPFLAFPDVAPGLMETMLLYFWKRAVHIALRESRKMFPTQNRVNNFGVGKAEGVKGSQ